MELDHLGLLEIAIEFSHRLLRSDCYWALNRVVGYKGAVTILAMDAVLRYLPLKGEELVMSKYPSLCVVGFIVLSYGAGAAAQSTSPCCCGTGSSAPVTNSGQSYQRYSYAPVQSQPAMVMGTVIAPNQPTYYSTPSSVISSQPMVQNQAMSSDGYRRFSYQPSSSGVSTSYKRPWEYPKADSHRYRP